MVFYVVEHQYIYISKPLLSTVQSGYVKTNGPVCSGSLSQNSSLQFITDHCAPPHCSNSYVCCFTKFCFCEKLPYLLAKTYARSPATTERSTIQEHLFYKRKPLFSTFTAIFCPLLCMLPCLTNQTYRIY